MSNKNLPNLIYKRAFFTLSFLLINFAVIAQVYIASLSGANVTPPNGSTSTGLATITVSGNSMRVQCSYNGLTGTTTAAHIHAATAVPLTGNIGVACQNPNLTGFTIGLTNGNYDVTFDMTLSSSYSASYITSNGGITSTTWSALKTAFSEGRAYFDIHTTTFAGGEIKAFLIASPLAINVLQFDAAVHNNNSAFLNWRIEQAEANTSFIVQKSIDGQNFYDLNTQISNSTQVQFSFLDKTLSSGNYFYRLKIIDSRGITKYSNITSAKIKTDNLLIKINPNPATESITVTVGDAALINTSVCIYNAQMQVIDCQKLLLNYQKININNFSSGLYFIKFANGSVQKFIKQ